LEKSLQLQLAALEKSCQNLRFIDYHFTEEACRRLAFQLIERIGMAECQRTRFVAIPRGGFVILGLLAAILGLEREQLEPVTPDDPLAVIVDDCSLSGARLAQFLRGCPARRLVFAPLFSPAELRAAILRQESRIINCCSAEDLERLGDISPRLREQELETKRGSRYWIGQIAPIAFPWNEPDRLLWNPETGQHELAWRIVPPELCLKNRQPSPRGSSLVQIQPRAKGPLRPSDRVLFAEIDQRIVICDLAQQKSFTFAGTGSDLWRGIVRHGDIEATVDEVAAGYDAPRETILRDARQFVNALLDRGLLEEATCLASAD
jgi:hypothetical protein